MSDNLTVIYAARTIQQAHLLKNLLAEAGIRAVVTNEVLEGGSGGGVVGWATLAQVAVAEHDAQFARRIALDFDAGSSTPPDSSAEEPEPSDEQFDAPPRCPWCSAQRPARCPICHTEGTDFRVADPEFAAPFGLAEDAKPMSCGCGSGTCSTSGPAATEDQTDDATETTQSESQSPERILMCPTCDEPFVPEYARQCRQCGHQFDDGFALEESQLVEPLSRRTIAVILGLLALLIGLVVYFAMVL